MDKEEMESRIHDLEASVAELETRLTEHLSFIGILLGRLALENKAPDLGLPTAERRTEDYEIQLDILGSYNRAADLA